MLDRESAAAWLAAHRSEAPPDYGAILPSELRDEGKIAQLTADILSRSHFSKLPIDDEVSRSAFDSYVERLDATKMFLLRADRDAVLTGLDVLERERAVRLGGGALDLAGHDPRDGNRPRATRAVGDRRSAPRHRRDRALVG